MTALDVDFDLDIDFDAVVACRYVLHRVLPGDEPAFLLLVIAPTTECCGKKNAPHLPICRPCWKYRNHLGVCRCECGAITPCMASIVRTVLL